jgi:hypothetical protein
MGREVRKVPHDWQHPQRDGRYEPLLDGYEVNAAQWLTEIKAWLRDGEQGEHFWIGNPPPNPEHYMLVGVPDGARTHLMLYETTTEGTPCGPAFATMDELCAWAEKNATTFAHMTTTAANWKRMLDDGFVTATDPDCPNIIFC